MEYEPQENAGLIAEIAGTPIQGIPLTEFQEYYLKTEIDPRVDQWIRGLDEEMARRQKQDEYYRRTHDYKNYERP